MFTPDFQQGSLYQWVIFVSPLILDPPRVPRKVDTHIVKIKRFFLDFIHTVLYNCKHASHRQYTRKHKRRNMDTYLNYVK